MNKYFTTRTIDRSCNVGDGRTVIYCCGTPEAIATIHKMFCDAMPITRARALELVRRERYTFRVFNYSACPDCCHTAYIYPYWWDVGTAIDEVDSTGCIVIR